VNNQLYKSVVFVAELSHLVSSEELPFYRRSHLAGSQHKDSIC
jgi:hypothetical protein